MVMSIPWKIQPIIILVNKCLRGEIMYSAALKWKITHFCITMHLKEIFPAQSTSENRAASNCIKGYLWTKSYHSITWKKKIVTLIWCFPLLILSEPILKSPSPAQKRNLVRCTTIIRKTYPANVYWIEKLQQNQEDKFLKEKLWAIFCVFYRKI